MQLLRWAGALALAVTCGPTAIAAPKGFDGKLAFNYTREVVEFGERVPGSAAHKRLEEFILRRLKLAGARVESDRFTADTPRGPLPMHNIIAKLGPATGRITMVAGHYDTKFLPNFVGANDGGASTGMLLALADTLGRDADLHSPVWLLFLDGEEAVKNWTDADSVYGSRHLVQHFVQTGLAPQIRAVLLVDMIGDRDLDIARETNSTRWVQDFIASAAQQLGYGKYFFQQETAISDDHIPFLHAGIPAVDLGDFTYGPMGPRYDSMGKYHHSPEDTMDKLSAHSFTVVGAVVLRTIELLGRQ